VKQSRKCADLRFSVTENGFAVKDEHLKTTEEALQDNDRVNYFKGITDALKDAVLEDGVDVRAYFPWSMYCSRLHQDEVFSCTCASPRRLFG
jgi:beta-glucosidase/6-phospho-beta-glucosidase/beta-galactosidase